jgi:hypothetical protein
MTCKNAPFGGNPPTVACQATRPFAGLMAENALNDVGPGVVLASSTSPSASTCCIPFGSENPPLPTWASASHEPDGSVQRMAPVAMDTTWRVPSAKNTPWGYKVPVPKLDREMTECMR